MNNFKCLLPGGVIFGAGQVENLGEKIANKSALLLSDRGVVNSGIADRIRDMCRTSASRLKEFFDVPAEPREDEVTDIVASLSGDPFDVIVAVGGGSVMDVAKLLAVMINDGPSLSEMFEGALPAARNNSLIMVPTTAGTGSEATPNAIVFRPAYNLKVGIVCDLFLPDRVILDPELLLKLPATITASTGLDALCHAVECYISKRASVFSNLLAVEAIRLIFKSLVRCYTDGSDLQARADMLLASFYAGVCIGSAGTNIVHALSYPLGGRYRIPHGVSNAILLAPAIAANKACCSEKLAGIAALTGKKTEGLSEEQRADLFIEALRDLCRDLGIPQKLSELGVPAEDLESNVDAAFEVKRLLTNNPKSLTKDDIRSVYLSIL